MSVTKIFKTPRLRSTLDREELNYNAGPFPADQAEQRAYIVLNGCQDTNALGEAPSGRMVYTEFAMPRAVKDSEPFNIEIYKDEDLKYLIAEMTDGVRITKKSIKEGPLTGVTIEPDNA